MARKEFYYDLDGLEVGKLVNWRINPLTTSERNALSLDSTKKGFFVFDVDEDAPYVWNGAGWTPMAGGGGGITDHGALTGLGDDDHTQYHNNARGDARYPLIADVQTDLDSKVDENAPITGATNTKITYDAKGLVTSGTAATTADINDSSNRRYVTDAQLVVVGNTSGTNTGDQSLAGLQPLDSDLTAIAALSPANDDIIQRKGGVWTNRTMAQLQADLPGGGGGGSDTNWANTDLVFTGNRTHQQSGGTLSLQSVGDTDYYNSYLNNSKSGFDSYKQYTNTGYYTRIQQTIGSTGGIVSMQADSIYPQVHVTVQSSNSASNNYITLGTGNGTFAVGGPNFGATLSSGGLYLSSNYAAGGYDIPTPARALAIDSGSLVSTVPMPVDGVQLAIMKGLGTTIKGMGVVPQHQSTVGIVMSDNTRRYVPVWVFDNSTITGVNWWQHVIGAYTADNDNMIKLYSYNSATGAMTEVATTGNVANLWQTAASNSLGTQAFTTPYVATKGVYILGMIYNSSAGTAPQIGGCTNASNVGLLGWGYNNSAKLSGVVVAQTTLPSSQNMSDLTTNLSNPFVALY